MLCLNDILKALLSIKPQFFLLGCDDNVIRPTSAYSECVYAGENAQVQSGQGLLFMLERERPFFGEINRPTNVPKQPLRTLTMQHYSTGNFDRHLCNL